MKTRTITGILACAMSVALITPAFAKTVKFSGTACWIGDIEYLSTGKKDLTWSWKADYTFIPDDNDPKKVGSGKCFGHGGVVDGKPAASPTFCTRNYGDNGKYMERLTGGPKGAKGIMFGGVGPYKGVTGTIVEGLSITVPADKGKIAGCRPWTGEHNIPG
jgi:hypothetical protein